MSDTKSKIMKVEPKRSKRLEEKNKKRKQNEDSDSDGETIYSTESDEEMDVHEYRKFLSNIFPSRHLNEKIKAGEKLNTINKKSKKQEEIEISDSDEGDNEYVPSPKNKKKAPEKFNLIFTIGNSKKTDQYDDDSEEEYDDDDSEWEPDEGSDTENEDDSVSSVADSESEEQDEVLLTKKHKNQKIQKKEKESSGENKESNKTNILETETLLKILKEMNDPSITSAVGECIRVCEDNMKKKGKKLEKKTQKHKEKNERIFRKMLSDKNTTNDYAFFHKMEIEGQKKIIKELREINNISRIEKPYRLTLLESDIPVMFKASAMKKVSSLRYMEPGSGEFYKIKNWVDTFMRIPFGKTEQLSICIEDGVETCHNFMETAQNTLNNAVYGLNDAKMQIMQMVGQLITNPKAIGTAIAIHGPPGTGKTSLVKEGISKILNRPFAFIALGGATDSSFLEGHSYTYEGSVWGKIVQILIDSKCMNPVIYFDELDKISDTPKGEEIAGILTHLTDTSQNSQFHDKYFSEIDFDLSKCLFIFSYNDESKVNPILKDRMYRIQTKGYDKKQKTVIAKEHLLPKIREQVKFSNEDIIIPDESLHYIIESFCNKEDGVRNLKRCLEIIYTKLNLYRLMKPGSNLFEEEMAITVSFPLIVTKPIIDKLININKDANTVFSSMYI